MDPKGPAQPSLDTAYETAGNPADQNPAEQRKANANANSNDGSIDAQREAGDLPVASKHQEEATPTAMARGVRGSGQDKSDAEVGRGVSDTEGDALATFGEGEVARAQDNKTGFGEQPDLASDLDRKKAEQQEARDNIKEQRSQDVDVGGILGQRGGPAVVEGRDQGAT